MPDQPSLHTTMKCITSSRRRTSNSHGSILSWFVVHLLGSELRSGVKVEMAVLGSPSPNSPYGLCGCKFIVQELCESRGGRPGLSVLTSLLVSVDVNIY